MFKVSLFTNHMYFFQHTILQKNKVINSIQISIFKIKFICLKYQLMSKIKGEKIVEAIKTHYEKLTNTILPQSQQFSKGLQDFHQKQYKDLQQIENEVSKVIVNFKKKYDQCQQNLHEIQTQWEKVKKFSTTGKGFLNAKSEQIKSKTKNLDQVGTGLKETVSKIKPMKLAQLPVEKQKILQNLFQSLFAILYHQKKSGFDWKSFKKLALKHEEGQDFLYRLVNLNFKDLNSEEYEMLLILKNDPAFQNFCVKSQFAPQIIDIADWIEYVCVGHQFSLQKKGAQKEYEKIRKDMSKRSGGSLEMSKRFWKQALDEIDKFQNNLLGLETQIKTLKIGAQNSIESIRQSDEWRNEQIAKLNNIIE